jgi:hypothetical protein
VYYWHDLRHLPLDSYCRAHEGTMSRMWTPAEIWAGQVLCSEAYSVYMRHFQDIMEWGEFMKFVNL